ncbi:cellulose-binding domain-containing protein [Catenuloplanes japonicus]|uniref:cellulose-binding domain-containing protein n=1 Tax=Catenuloplanes japonicus TaxID=33876 RepID=UPI00068F67C1|nr:cellulose-binding domain-containing protein [Catenuloplanes japonicus]
MRRKLAGALAAVLATGVVAVVTQATGQQAFAAAADPYTWKNVRIDGGGFVPGVVFNRKEKNLIYARTDIGGAYRWNETGQNWVPLLDWVGQNNWGYNGVLSIATDAVDPNRVYAAVGMYTNDWDPNNGAIIRSADRGATWQVTPLPFKVGGNMPGRGQGERLSIDPNNNRILYFGAEDGNGLWRSTDQGVTWAKVTNFPNVGNYAQDPSDANGYLNHNQGVTWVTFDESTGSAGSTTQTIYVGVADKANPVYRTTNGGTSWERLPGSPTGYLAHKGVLDTVNDQLYLATSDTGGPYDGGHGQVWKFGTGTGAWTDISPVPVSSADQYFGYSGLTVDRQNPNTLIVGTQISWWPDAIFWRSTNGGATWSRIWDYNGYPNRVNKYTMDISSAPWLDFGESPSAPVQAPKLGWMNESIEIDPFNSDRMLYGTGATVYGTTQLTNWDSGATFTIKPFVKGLEETAVLDLVSPPTGAPLVSALGDIGGFHHANLDTVPADMHLSPTLGSNTGIDFAELNPSVMVRVGNVNKTDYPNVNRIGVSTDGGKTWYQGQEPAGVTNGGKVAISADAGSVVWAPDGTNVFYSTTRGSSWSQSTGIPAGAKIEADRVNPATFYGWSGGVFYVSTNGGATFTASSATVPTSGRVNFKAVAGSEGDVWITGDQGLFRSTNSGASFTKVATVTSAINVGFGKAAPGGSYQAVYLVGTVDGVTGVFRSDNAGGAWVRINDDAHQYGNMGDALTGDPRIFGRVYLGTNGRGILYADRNSTSTPTATATPTGPASPTPTASPTVSPTASPSPTGNPAGGCAAVYKVTGQWTGGFQGEVTVTNSGSTATTGWRVGWTFADGQSISQVWGGTLTQTGTAVSVANVSWNGTLAPNASTTFGFLGSWTGTNAIPAVTCTRI